MLRLRDIMTSDVVTVSPELSLRDAMVLFTARHFSGAPVVANNRLVGVITLTDLVEFAAAAPSVSRERAELDPAEDFEAEPEWVGDDEPPSAFFAELWEDGGADVAERFAAAEGPECNALEEHVVSEAMNTRVVSLPPDASVEEAADFMRRSGIHRVLVMDGQALVGLVSTKDVSNAVADHRLTRRVYVFGRGRGGSR